MLPRHPSIAIVAPIGVTFTTAGGGGIDTHPCTARATWYWRGVRDSRGARALPLHEDSMIAKDFG